jgi:hypothetical protein
MLALAVLQMCHASGATAHLFSCGCCRMNTPPVCVRLISHVRGCFHMSEVDFTHQKLTTHKRRPHTHTHATSDPRKASIQRAVQLFICPVDLWGLTVRYYSHDCVSAISASWGRYCALIFARLCVRNLCVMKALRRVTIRASVFTISA